MTKLKTKVTRTTPTRRDAGRRRKHPRGNTELGSGYRVNPETNRPELWCSNCETYKHVTLFKKIDSPRSQRVCLECEERLSKACAVETGIRSIIANPHGGRSKFADQVWKYLKPVLVKKDSKKGKKRTPGRPRTRLIKGRAATRILAGTKDLPESYVDPLRTAILDPEERVHYKTRLWLAFRQGVLGNRKLRLCACSLAAKIMDDVTESTQDDIYFGLSGVITDMRALATGENFYSRQRLENLRARVSGLEKKIARREARNDYDHLARRVFFVLTALLSGSALIALHTIAYEFYIHFSFKYDKDDIVLQDMLVRICDTIENDNEFKERAVIKAQKEVHTTKEEDHLIGTFWQEYDHHSPTRFLLVTDTHKHAVQLRVFSNEDTPEEVGEYVNAMRSQFEGLGPGYFLQLLPEDIRDSGVPVGRINRRFRSWGLAPIPTELDDARQRLEEIESEEAEADSEQ